MNYRDYNDKIIHFIRDKDRFSDDKKLETFYELIEELEEQAKEDKKYYELLSICYEQVGDFYKAQTCFEKVCHPKDKKALKRYSYLSGTREIVKIRPGQRCDTIPAFRYVSPDVLKNYFVHAKQGQRCCICGKENVDFYAGYAYKDKALIVFSEDRERFCSECLSNGKAAEEKNITFNHWLIAELKVVAEKKRQILLKCTPGCSQDFDLDETIWPICCDDFCCYMGSDHFESNFKCVECGKEIVWIHQ